MSIAPVRAAAVLAAAVVLVAFAVATAAALEPAFVAMDGERFALATKSDQGVLVRFARGQFGDDRTAFVLGFWYPGFLYDETSGTLLLTLGYEGSQLVVGFTPDGQELYRVHPDSQFHNDVALVPGAGQFCFICSDGLELRSCRTGEVVHPAPSSNPDNDLWEAMFIGGGAVLTACGPAGGRQLIARDLRSGAELWRRPDEAEGFMANRTAAYDDQRIYTAVSLMAETVITARARSDGAVLTSSTLDAYGAVIYTDPDLAWLVTFVASAEHCGRLLLLDKDTLAEVREIPLPEARYPMNLRAARPLAPGRVLLDGYYSICRGKDTADIFGCRQMILYLDLKQPVVRFFSKPLSIAPDGSGWSLGTQRQEVVGAVPRVRPTDLDPYGSILPDAVLRGSLQILEDYRGPESVLYDGRIYRMPGRDTAAFNRLLESSDACFCGTLESVVYFCLGSPRGPRDGVAKARFRIDERFWGPQGVVTVYIDGFDVADCVRYRSPVRPAADEFLTGSRHVVVASYDEGAFVVRGAGLFPFGQDELMFSGRDSFALADPLGLMRELGARFDLQEQFARADLVVEGEIAPFHGEATNLAVAKVHKGAVACGCIAVDRIRVDGRTQSWMHRGDRGDPPQAHTYLLFLREAESGRYALLEGRWSVLRNSGGAYLRESGYVVKEVPFILGTR